MSHSKQNLQLPKSPNATPMLTCEHALSSCQSSFSLVLILSYMRAAMLKGSMALSIEIFSLLYSRTFQPPNLKICLLSHNQAYNGIYTHSKEKFVGPELLQC